MLEHIYKIEPLYTIAGFATKQDERAIEAIGFKWGGEGKEKRSWDQKVILFSSHRNLNAEIWPKNNETLST